VPYGEPDICVVGSEDALLFFGPAGASPPSVFVDLKTGALREGPPQPLDDAKKPYFPAYVQWHEPTDTIWAFGSIWTKAGTLTTYRRAAAAPRASASAEAPRLPSWVTKLKVGEWGRVPGSKLEALGAVGGHRAAHTRALVIAYSGAALRRTGSEILLHGGGHADGANNMVVGLPLESEKPAWRVVIPPSPATAVRLDAPYYADGKPSAIHSYYVLVVNDRLDKLFRFGAPVTWGTSSGSFPNVDAVDLKTGRWDPPSTWAPLWAAKGGSYLVTKDPRSEDVYVGLGSTLRRFSVDANRWTEVRSDKWSFAAGGGATIDTTRGYVLRHEIWNSDGRVKTMLLPLDGSEKRFVTLSGSAHSELLKPAVSYSYGGYPFHYDPRLDRILHYKGQAGKVYEINPDTWEVSELPTSGDAPPAWNRDSGIWNRFLPVPALGGYAYVHDWDSDVYFLRTHRRAAGFPSVRDLLER
jgi:hypothetical protein